MDLVISYSSTDRDKLRPLLDGLHRLRHTVWFDQELTGGQDWWDAILSRIRGCDALLLALSPAYLESEACALEGDYARAVGRPILPVMIERVSPELLPPALAAVQIVDFTNPGTGAFGLVAALTDLPQPKPLPDPLPEPPRVPVSYLGELGERVAAPQLALDEQLSLVGKLRHSLTRPRERDAALVLIQRFRARNDLYLAPAQELDAMLAENPPKPPEEVTPGPSRPDPPPPDPREEWSRWALTEFGGDGELARVGTDAAVAQLGTGGSAEAAAAAARSAVEAERQRRLRQQGSQQGVQQGVRQDFQQATGPKRTDGEATAALVLGILGIACGGLILNGLAIWLGRRAQRRITASGGLLAGAGQAKAGVYLGIAGLILWGLILLVYAVAAASQQPSTPAV
jgi:hypothetical protein